MEVSGRKRERDCGGEGGRGRSGWGALVMLVFNGVETIYASELRSVGNCIVTVSSA